MPGSQASHDRRNKRRPFPRSRRACGPAAPAPSPRAALGENERGFVLHVQVAADLQRRDALCAVHEDDDRGEQIRKAQLARGEDCTARHRKLVMTGNALEAPARRDVVGLDTATARAHGLAFRFGPTKLAEGLVSLVLAHLENSLEAESAGGGGKEEVLHYHRIQCLCIGYSDNHALPSMAFVSYMMAFAMNGVAYENAEGLGGSGQGLAQG